MKEGTHFSAIVEAQHKDGFMNAAEGAGVQLITNILTHLVVVNADSPESDTRFLRICGVGDQGVVEALTSVLQSTDTPLSATVYAGEYQQREDGPLWLK